MSARRPNRESSARLACVAGRNHDDGAGRITVDQGPISGGGLAGDDHGLQSRACLVQSVKAGDRVAFDLTLKDGGGEITAITKQ